jgi:DNA polymerase V
MKLITGEFEKRLQLQFAPSVRAGFPSLAEDYLNESLDYTLLYKERECTSLWTLPKLINTMNLTWVQR